MTNSQEQSPEVRVGKLIGSVGRLHAKQLDRLVEQIGLYRGQAILLMTLSRNDGMMHSEIAERLEISPAAATKVIKRMEALNYIQRRSDPADERISRVFLLEEGQKVIQQIRTAFAIEDAHLVSNLTPDEQAVLTRLLTRVYDTLMNDPLESSSSQG